MAAQGKAFADSAYRGNAADAWDTAIEDAADLIKSRRWLDANTEQGDS